MSRIIFFRVTLIFYSIMVLPNSVLTVLNKLSSRGTNTSARMEKFTLPRKAGVSARFSIQNGDD